MIKLGVFGLGTREGRLPQLHICGYHVDQVLGSDWLQSSQRGAIQRFNLKLENIFSLPFFARSVDRGVKSSNLFFKVALLWKNKDMKVMGEKYLYKYI